MRFFIALFLSCSLPLVSQEPVLTLKKSLFEAQEQFHVTFTFDDTLISGFIAFSEPLPDSLEAFQTILQNEYSLKSSQEGNTIILSRLYNSNQTTCGYVKSDLTETVLQNTLVLFGKQYAYVDNLGYFFFQNLNDELNELVFTSEKYGSTKQSVNRSEDCPVYYINSNEIGLNEVIVNYISPPIEKGFAGNFEFNLSQFRSSPGSINPDYFELLKLIPGINTPNEDNQLFIRGGTPDQNQILWNQIRLYQNNHANGSLASLNPYSIDNIKLYVKGVPSSYGDHTSGLILLDNYKAETKPLVGSFGIGLLDSDLVASANYQDKVQLNVSARSSFNTTLSDQFQTNTFNKIEVTNPEQKQVFSQQKIYYNDFSFSSRVHFNEAVNIDFHGFYMEDQIGYELLQENIDFSDFLTTKSTGFGLRTSLKKENWTHRYNLSFSDYQLGYERQLIQYEQDENEENGEKELEDLTQRKNQIQEILFSSNHKTKLANQFSLTAGSELLYRELGLFNQNTVNEVERLLEESLTGFNFSLFSTLSTSLFKNNTIDFGLRYNYFQSLGSSRIEPRLNLSQKMGRSWLVNASYEKKSQTIYRSNETIQNTTTRANNLWTFSGNEFYPLLKSTQYSLGLTRKGKGTILDFDLYNRKLDGISTFNFGYVDRNDRDFHLGESEVFGLDLFFQKSWSHLNLWTNYSFQDNKNRFDDLKGGVWFNSNFLVKHLLTLGANYQYKGWTLSSNFTYRSGVPYSKPSGFLLENQNYILQYTLLNTEFLPSFQRLDASLSKRILVRKTFKFDLKASFKNLTNRRNVLERIFVYDTNSQSIKAIDRYSMIPFVNFGLRFILD